MSRTKVKQAPIFKIGVSVRGNLQSSFCFEDQKQVDLWLKTEFVELQKKYGALTHSQYSLPGFKVGDSCYVYGEAQDTFKITQLIKYSENRYGFVLDSGWSEEVVKCHDGEEYGWNDAILN